MENRQIIIWRFRKQVYCNKEAEFRGILQCVFLTGEIKYSFQDDRFFAVVNQYVLMVFAK